MPGRTKKALSYLGINRNVAVLGTSLFGLGLGEELWQAYVPLYLISLGASGFLVGLFSSLKDFLDGIYQYPGGWINDRFGRKRALMLFTLTAMGGYAVSALAVHWALVFVGIVFIMAWKSGAFPATFAVIGDALPPGRRAIAFSVQSILVRVPRIVAAPLGGALIASLGVLTGIRVALGTTLVIAAGVLFIQRRFYLEQQTEHSGFRTNSAWRTFQQMPSSLKQLLLAECFVRIGEGIAAAFIVLYITTVRQYSPETYGMLYALQQSVAIISYIPAGKLADLSGRRLPVTLTFVAFAIFPLTVRLAESWTLLVVAFIIGGMKEFGEPARKSLIVDLSDPSQRGRAVGIYYTIRNLLVVPAGALGGLLWQVSPELPFVAAFGVGIIGVMIYVLKSKDNYNSNFHVKEG